MYNKISLLTLAGIALLAAACSEVSQTTGPLSDTANIHGTTDSTVPEIVRYAVGAPPLETYDTTFWAVQGQRTKFRVNYLALDINHPETGELQKFLDITIPKKTQLVAPDGHPLACQDSILISLNLDRDKLLVEFQPHGLTFGGTEPMEFVMWYVYGDLTGGGGSADSELDVWYQAYEGASWSKMNALSERGEAMIADIYHFSNFAVAW